MGTVAKETERDRLITIRSDLLEKKIASLFQKQTKTKKEARKVFSKKQAERTQPLFGHLSMERASQHT